MSAATVEVLSEALRGINDTRYLSAAGLVVLLYDHLLLLGQEIGVVWKSSWSYTKSLFLWNRYFVPAYFVLNAYVLSGLSTAGLSTSFCRGWIPTSIILGVLSLAFANVFIVERVWALWGRNMTILKLLVGTFICVYSTTLIITAFIFVQMIPDITYSPVLRTCIVAKKPRLLIGMYTVPIALDVFVFCLTCLNAFDRPRHMQTVITKQLITDGVIYFISIMILRLFNILVLAIGDVAYTQLGTHFLWSMITAIINRMLIRSGTVGVHPGLDPSGRQTPFKNNGPDTDDEDDDNTKSIHLYQLPNFNAVDRMPYNATVL